MTHAHGGNNMNAEDMLGQSILADVRAACSLDSNDNSFDQQLIPLINSQLMMAHQFGVGVDGFILWGTGETWRDFLGEDGNRLAAVSTWLGYSVKLLFDPPDNGTVLKSYQDQIAKMEWMLSSKSQTTGIVKQYVTEKQAAIYDDLFEYEDSQEEDEEGL